MNRRSAGSTQPRWRSMAGLTALLGAALLGAALAVRMVHLDTDPIWYDEAATIGIASMDWRVILGSMAQLESSPPGYYVVAKLWSALLDDSIWWLRMLSVLAGAGAIIPVLLLARAAFGAPAAWIAGAFIALAGSHVRLSQDARCYALLFLVTASAQLAAARLAGGGKSAVAAAVALGTLMGIGLWLHATAGLIVISLNLFVVVLLAYDRASLRRGLLLLVAADMLMLAIAARPLLTIQALLPPASQFRPVLLDRTALFMLLLAAGATALPRPALTQVVAAVLLLQALGVMRWHSLPDRKERWDQAAEILHAHMLPGEPIVLTDSSFVSISLARHLTAAGSPVPRMIAVPPHSPLEQLVAQQLMPDILSDVGELCRHLGAAVPGLWLVLREQPDAVAADRAFTTRHAVRDALLRGGGTLRETWRRPGIELQHWIAPRC